jgi:hypothetical protein
MPYVTGIEANQGGTSRAYIVGRLKREAAKAEGQDPLFLDDKVRLAAELLPQVEAGEISAYAAALAMGWQKRVPPDPYKQLMAWAATLEARGGHRRQGVLGRLAARRVPPQAHRADHPEPRRPAREPRLRSPGSSAAAQRGRAAGGHVEAVPARRDPLRQARRPLSRLCPTRFDCGLARRLW